MTALKFVCNLNLDLERLSGINVDIYKFEKAKWNCILKTVFAHYTVIITFNLKLILLFDYSILFYSAFQVIHMEIAEPL